MQPPPTVRSSRDSVRRLTRLVRREVFEENEMGRRIGALVVGLMLLASPLFAADIDGRWSGTLSTPGGDFPITFVFKAEGNTLTGSMLGMDGTPLPIANGKIDGDKISYTVTIDFGGMALEMIYKGVVKATEVQLEASVFDMPMALVVRRDDKK
jgi:hypothetical protein